MSPVEGVRFPDPAQWIVNFDALNNIGEALLDVTHGALELYGFGDRYERRYVGHGTRSIVEPSTANQLAVVCTRYHLGKPGEEQFQLIKGAIGIAGFHTAGFAVKISTPWPRRQGEQALKTTDIDEARAELWREGLIAWNGVLGLMLGGVVHPNVTPQNEIALGPLTPVDPQGGAASWLFEVHVLL